MTGLVMAFGWQCGVAAPGQLDSNFVSSVTGTAFTFLAAQSDHRIVAGAGSDAIIGGTNFGRLLRFHPDGTLDTSWPRVPGVILTRIAAQGNDQVLVAGTFNNWLGSGLKYLVRLNSDGSLDTNLVATRGLSSLGYSVAAAPGNKILVYSASALSSSNSTPLPCVVRLNPEGTLDPSLTMPSDVASAYAVSLWPDGSGGFALAYRDTSNQYKVGQFMADGTRVPTFTEGVFNTQPQWVHAFSNGTILVAGGFAQFNGGAVPKLIRLSADGTRDTGYIVTETLGAPERTLAQADGRVIYATGAFPQLLDRLTTTGVRDTNWTAAFGSYGYYASVLDRLERPVVCAYNSANFLVGVYRMQSDAGLIPVPPFITSQPASRTNYVGENAIFTASAGGTGPLAYQWQFNSTNLPNATNATLVISNCQSSDAGPYQLIVTNASGATNSIVATLTLRLDPRIVQGPGSVTNDASLPVSFIVHAVGLAPLSFTWLFNGAPFGAADSSVLNLPAVSSTNAGGYSVIVSNDYGAVTSTLATLTVNSTLRFTQQPATNLELAYGQPAVLNAVAVGEPPLFLQWIKDGAPLPGGTVAPWLIPSATHADAGAYFLVASNASGAITSVTTRVAVVGASAFNWLWLSNAVPGSGNDVWQDGRFGLLVGGSLGVARFDDDGTRLWAQQVTSTNGSNVFAVACVAGDGQGNAYCAGAFTGIATIGGTLITNSTGSATFLAKLDLFGNVVWAQVIEGDLYVPQLATDPQGNALIVGAHTSILRVNGNQVANANAYGSGAILKFSPAGSVLWSRSYRYNSTVGNVEVSNVAADTNSIYVIGHFNATINFGGFTATTTPANPWHWMGRLDTNGTPLWLRTRGSGGQGGQVAIGPDKSAWFSGWNGGGAVFLSRYLTNGNFIFDVNAASGSASSRTGLNVDSNNFAVLGGRFSASTTVGTNYFYKPHGAYEYLYVGRYGTNGAGVGAREVGMATNGGSFSTYAFAASAKGDAYFAGFVSGGAQIGSSNFFASSPFVTKVAAPGLAPVIISGPFGGTANSFANPTLSVTANGLAPLSYQWLLNGVPIPGATNNPHVVSNALPANSGLYTVIVSNAYGIASSSATLTITPPFTFLRQPGNQLVILGGSLCGTNITEADIAPSALVGKAIEGTITSGSNYWPASGNFRLNLPIASSYNIPASGVLGSHSGTYSASAIAGFGTAMTLNLFLRPSPYTNATLFLMPGGRLNDLHLDIADPMGCCAWGTYCITGGTSNASFSFQLNSVSLSDTNLSFQWLREGVTMPGQTNATLSLTNVTLANAGGYAVQVAYRGYTNVSQTAQLRVGPTTSPNPTVAYTFVPGGSTMGFTWPAGWVLQSTDTLSPPNWQNIATNSPYEAPVTGPGQFFRLMQMPP